MKKIVNMLYLAGIFLILVSALFGIMRYKSAFHIVATAGICLFLISGVVFLFKPSLYVRRLYQFNAEFNARRKTLNIILMSGTILAMAGILLRINRVEGSTVIVSAGLIIAIISYTLICLLAYNRKQYLVDLTPAITVSDAELHQYTGNYFCETLKESMAVWVENGILTARLGSQSSFPLTAVKEYVFNYLDAGLVMEFSADKQQFTLIQAGQYLPFVKQDAQENHRDLT